MKNTCIIIPTHERQTYLNRCISYYEHFPVKVIICDSSKTAYAEKLPANIFYQHLPGAKFAQKILFALNRADENLVALAADDDFLFEGALARGVEILRHNTALQACVGDVLTFPDRQPFRVIGRRAGGAANAVTTSAEKNIVAYLSNYHQILWSLFRLDVLKLCFEIMDLAEFENENFFELTISAICAGKGGINYLDDYWILREISSNEHWGSHHLPVTRTRLTSLNSDVNKFCQAIDRALFLGAGDLALAAYLSSSSLPLKYPYSIRNIFLKLFRKIFKRDTDQVDWKRDKRFSSILKIIG